MSFTPGPYIIVQGLGDQLTIRVEGRPLDSILCRLVPEALHAEHGGSVPANARLFAFAPTAHQLVREALKALQVIGVRDWITTARAYLAAVEGE